MEASLVFAYKGEYIKVGPALMQKTPWTPLNSRLFLAHLVSRACVCLSREKGHRMICAANIHEIDITL